MATVSRQGGAAGRVEVIRKRKEESGHRSSREKGNPVFIAAFQPIRVHNPLVTWPTFQRRGGGGTPTRRKGRKTLFHSFSPSPSSRWFFCYSLSLLFWVFKCFLPVFFRDESCFFLFLNVCVRPFLSGRVV